MSDRALTPEQNLRAALLAAADLMELVVDRLEAALARERALREAIQPFREGWLFVGSLDTKVRFLWVGEVESIERLQALAATPAAAPEADRDLSRGALGDALHSRMAQSPATPEVRA